MLEHLIAQDDVEARVLDRERLDRPDQIRRWVLDDVDADVFRGRREVRVVRLDAAADVEDAQISHGLAFLLQPAG